MTTQSASISHTLVLNPISHAPQKMEICASPRTRIHTVNLIGHYIVSLFAEDGLRAKPDNVSTSLKDSHMFLKQSNVDH